MQFKGFLGVIHLFFNFFSFINFFIRKTTPSIEYRQPPDGNGGGAAAAQPTRGLDVSTAATRLEG